MSKYTISDIHGCSKSFKALLKKIDLSKKDELYLLGDYVDRGPDSKGVIDHIWCLQEAGYQVHCLRGNHEDKMLSSCKSGKDMQEWLYWGGRQTLGSFSVQTGNEVPIKYQDWIDGLPFYFEVDNYILVHAGLNFEVRDPMNDEESMMWMRGYYHTINYEWLKERIIVHGHTPVSKAEIGSLRTDIKKNQYINIDNGCYYDRPGQGNLCCFSLNDRTLTFQKNIDRYVS